MQVKTKKKPVKKATAKMAAVKLNAAQKKHVKEINQDQLERFVKATGVDMTFHLSERNISVEPIVLVIKNDTPDKKKVALFGSISNIPKPNFGNDEGVVVECPFETSINYSEILYSFLSEKTIISLIRIVADNKKFFFKNRLDIFSKSTNGEWSQRPIDIDKFDKMTKKRLHKNLLDIDCEIYLYRSVQLSIDVPAKASVSLFLYPKSKQEILDGFKNII